ncbi:MAG: DUF501 domain-containing protein [Candidatus Muiribacteriota bacterium]
MEKDYKNILKKQLGKKNLIPCTVVKVCPYDFPVVVKLKADLKKPHFKTLYWLSCPYINKKISTLESRGFISVVKQYILDNYDEYRKFVNKYSDDRDSLKLKQYGIGGVADIKNPKCLHAHFAYYLVENNYNAGKYIKNKIDNIYCDKKEPLCKRFLGGNS